jgi:hypothetical protein
MHVWQDAHGIAYGYGKAIDEIEARDIELFEGLT